MIVVERFSVSSDLLVTDQQMKEYQDQLEAESYFSVSSRPFDNNINSLNMVKKCCPLCLFKIICGQVDSSNFRVFLQ